MRRLLLLTPLLFSLLLLGCGKDKKENPQPAELNKILVNYPWRMSTVTDLSGRDIPSNQLNMQTQAIKTSMDIQFMQNNVTRAIDQLSKQVINGGTWYLINENKTLDIRISGFAGEFGLEELTNSRLRLRSKMPVNGVEQETIMVFQPVI
jgi:hypothetical protein